MGIAARGVASNAPTAIRTPAAPTAGTPIAAIARARACGTPLMRPPLVIAAVATIAGHERDRERRRTRRRARSARRPPRAARSPAPRRSAISRVSPSSQPPRERGGERDERDAARDLQDRGAHAAAAVRAWRRPAACAGAPPRSARAARRHPAAQLRVGDRLGERACRASRRSRPGPRAASAATVAAITRAVSGSSAAVGSSSRIASGSRVSARASATRARSPPRQRLRRARQERGVEPGGGERRVAGVVGAAPSSP